MCSIKRKPKFDKHCEKVKFPNPLVESRRLELLDEVSIKIFVPAHHRLDYPPSRKEANFGCNLTEVWVQFFKRMDRSEKINWLTRFITLVVKFIRRIEQFAHLFRQFVTRPLRALHKICHGSPPKAQFCVSTEDHTSEVTVSPILDDHAKETSTFGLIVGYFLASQRCSWMPCIASNRVETQF